MQPNFLNLSHFFLDRPRRALRSSLCARPRLGEWALNTTDGCTSIGAARNSGGRSRNPGGPLEEATVSARASFGGTPSCAARTEEVRAPAVPGVLGQIAGLPPKRDASCEMIREKRNDASAYRRRARYGVEGTGVESSSAAARSPSKHPFRYAALSLISIVERRWTGAFRRVLEGNCRKAAVRFPLARDGRDRSRSRSLHFARLDQHFENCDQMVVTAIRN